MSENVIDPMPVIFLLTFMLWAAANDILEHRVPNAMVGTLLIAGLAFAGFGVGEQTLTSAFAGLLVGLLVFLPFYAMGGIGAADVKLLAAAGTFLGPLPIVVAGIGATGAGALYAAVLYAIIQIKNYRPPEASADSDGSGADAAYEGALLDAGKTPFPFVPFIAAGVFLATFYQMGAGG